MAKIPDSKISDSELQKAVRAILKREPPFTSPVQISGGNQSLSLRRKLGKKLKPIFAESGLDVKKIDKLLEEHQDGLLRHFKTQGKKVDKELKGLEEQFRAELENRIRAFEHIAGKPLTITLIPIYTPFSIYANPSSMLVDSSIEFSNSSAKITHFYSSDTTYRTVSLKFFFAWENSTDYYAVINANAALIVRGVCQANAVGGVFFGGWVDLGLTANLKVHLGGAVLGGSYVSITRLTADTWGAAFFGDGDLQTANIYTTPIMSRKNILVQDHQLVIFEVSLDATYWIDSGSITIDFSFQDRNIICPALEIELLTAP